MENEFDLSIIIPAYYEEAVIGTIVERIRGVMESQSVSYELLIIDDGSQDNTAVNAKSAGATVISHPYNIGNGAAIKTGIRSAKGKFVLMMDADGQHPPELIPELLAKCETYHMVVGARTKASDSKWYRDIANMIYNRLASYVSDFQIEDLTSGFRVIRRSVALEFVYLLPNQFSYPTTLTMSVIRAGYNLKYIPFAAPQRVGKSKIKLLRDGSKFLMIIFKIATLFSPLKVFIPASVATFLLGVLYGGFKVIFLSTRYGPTSANLMITAVIIFFMGLISEQITYLRYK